MKIICYTVQFLLLYHSVFSSANTNNNDSYVDEQALLVFKNSIISDPHKTLSTWTANTNFCTWIGITCNLLMRVSSIDIGSRGFKGYISPFVGNLSHLEKFSISNNTFQGGIPPQLCHKLGNLQELYLWGNQLSGPIPASIGNCSKLVLIGLSFNKINGTVPLELGKLISLQRLMLDNNLLTSTRTLPFLTALVNCSALQTLYLGFNHLNGVLPLSIGKLSSSLSVLSLQDNHIGGNIPHQIGNLTGLTLINFTANVFTGTIPPTLGKLDILERLYLGNNQLQGNIPNEICVLGKRLGLLFLSFNQLSGQIPETIGNLLQLRYIYFDNNQLVGRIPASLGKCWVLELIDLSHNKLTGNIPPEVAVLPNLQIYFNLSWNSLQGSLPIIRMPMIQGIDLSRNNLSGTIQNFGWSNLEYLNLSHNLFEGPVPLTVLSMPLYMQYIDLNFNNLSGNLSICGGMLYTPACPSREKSGRPIPGESGGPIPGESGGPIPGKSGGQGHFNVLFVYITVAGIVYCLYIAFLWKCYCGSQKSELSDDLGHPRISYKELSIATNGFAMGNLLGVGSVGSVYKGVLDDGTLIAVKVLNLHNNSAYNSFITECQVLRKVMHRNLIRVITSCSNLDFKGLVLEFMCNGNLEKQLHCDTSMRNIGGVCNMNLQTRLQIAIDIARGLAYLHHDCSIQVVHCDLKPSNVLLDYYMTARLADFGNAQILSENSMHTVSSPKTLKGTLGYIAPEYGISANVSTKGDVYSYGILLLEILTRKRPTHQMFADGLNLRMWVSMVFPERIAEVIDNSLMQCNGGATDAICHCLIEMTRVALLCTKAYPTDRPSMAQVVELLESIDMTLKGSRLETKYPSDPYQMLGGTTSVTNRGNAVRGHSTSTFSIVS